VASTSTSTDATGSKKKKRVKKRKRQAEEAQDPGVNEEKPRKKRVVETVHDPSAISSSVSSSKRTIKPGKVVGATKLKTAEKEKEDLDRFKDSRGTGPRRKTEEGFSIFKEAELGINPEAGGTPLCPFDCDCCF